MEISRESLPLHLQVRLKIEDYLCTLSEGDKIPGGEMGLCRKLGVSRITVRRALGDLADEGILSSCQGKGTFLKKRPMKKERNATSRIGLLVPEINNSFIARIVKGVENEISRRDYELIFSHYQSSDPELQFSKLNQMLERGVDGIIIYPAAPTACRAKHVELFRRAESMNIPVIFVDHYFPEVNAMSVMTDNVAGMYMATDHLIKLGRRKFALLGFGKDAGIVDQQRRMGFQNALSDYKMKPNPVLEAELGVAGHETSAKRLVQEWIRKFNRRLPFDSIVCMQDNMAYGAFLALGEAGLKVPEDVALVGYDNLAMEAYKIIGLDLTSVDQPAEEMGAESSRILINHLEGISPIVNSRHILLKPKLVERSSCGEKIKSVPGLMLKK
ncbi:MAG: GntR family transcriptional regulator [Victivallales bacterium]